MRPPKGRGLLGMRVLYHGCNNSVKNVFQKNEAKDGAFFLLGISACPSAHFSCHSERSEESVSPVLEKGRGRGFFGLWPQNDEEGGAFKILLRISFVVPRISLVILSGAKNPSLPSRKKDEGADSSSYGLRMTRRGAFSRSFCAFLLSF